MRSDLPLSVLGVSLLAACQPLPGEVIGTYSVTMALEENSCGLTAVHPLDGKKYAVELRDDDELAYWRIPGQTPIQGKYETPDFSFEYSSVVATGLNDAGMATCRLIQSELLTGRVALTDAGVEPIDLDASSDVGDQNSEGVAMIGAHQLTITPQPGSDCSEAVPPKGAFEKLPCVVRYGLVGVKRKPL